MNSTITIRLNPQRKAEKPMRNILGINNSPRITTQACKASDIAAFDALNFRYIRYHDAPLENPGKQIIDIHAIFPLFHLDENDPKNYCFAQTDDYLRVIADTGAEIDFRLGETVDHSGNARLIGVPEDIEKWARICRNIVAHYKNGEMDGMHLNIRHITVWEEPDNPKLLNGTLEQYAEMFCTVYRLLKKDFPDLEIGGPTMISSSYEYLRNFLTICKREGIRPDYISFTIYSRDIQYLLNSMATYHAIAEELGFYDMRYHLAEWHLGPTAWDRTNHVEECGFDSAVSASYTSSALMQMMDVDYLRAAYFYAWATRTWSVFNFRTSNVSVYPVYYGLLFFQKLAAECHERLAVDIENGDNVQVLAGRTTDGKTRLLISCYDQETCTLLVDVGGATSGTLHAVEMDYNEETCAKGSTVTAVNGKFTIAHKERYGVYLLELDG